MTSRRARYNRDLAQDNVYVTSLDGLRARAASAFRRCARASRREQSPQKRERCPQDMFDPILARGRVRSRASTCVTATSSSASSSTRPASSAHVHRSRRRNARSKSKRRICRLRRRRQPRREGDRGRHGRHAGALANDEHHFPRAAAAVAARQGRGLSLHHRRARRARGPRSSRSTAGTAGACRSCDTPPEGLTRGRRSRPRSAAPSGSTSSSRSSRSTTWTRRELVAQTLRQGRVFIAGDAAHVMSPTGGFGMNTGIGDAVDLSWKLDAVLRGWGGPALLDSYTPERRPVAVRNGREVEREPRAHALARPEPGAVRRYARRRGRRAEARPALRRGDEPRMVHAGHPSRLPLRRFADLLARRHGRAAARGRAATCKNRAPARARRTSGCATGARRSICSATASCCCASTAGRRSRTDRGGAARARRSGEGGRPVGEPAAARRMAADLVLVRPDGHVAWRGNDTADAEEMAGCVRGATEGVMISGQ